MQLFLDNMKSGKLIQKGCGAVIQTSGQYLREFVIEEENKMASLETKSLCKNTKIVCPIPRF